ncbi:hypothetical protein ABPG73_001381 [Tetrahymena malaccensis]
MQTQKKILQSRMSLFLNTYMIKEKSAQKLIKKYKIKSITQCHTQLRQGIRIWEKRKTTWLIAYITLYNNYTLRQSFTQIPNTLHQQLKQLLTGFEKKKD